eukprot:1253008-Rhodomonas_salina.1
MKWAEVDLSWRRKRLPFAPTSSNLPAYERRKRWSLHPPPLQFVHLLLQSSLLSQPVDCRRLFQLFKEFDTENTGTIKPSDLLAEEDRSEGKAVDFAQFCQVRGQRASERELIEGETGGATIVGGKGGRDVGRGRKES